jgi:hypothetical protein
MFMIASYGKICKQIGSSPLASLSLAVWTIMLFYDMTESAFRGGLLWLLLLLAAIVTASERAEDRVAARGNVGVAVRLRGTPVGATNFRK